MKKTKTQAERFNNQVFCMLGKWRVIANGDLLDATFETREEANEALRKARTTTQGEEK